MLKKEVFEKEAFELFELAMRVRKETEVYISFGIDSYTNACCIGIKEKVEMEKAKRYRIYINGFEEKESRKDYEDVKIHMLKLLGEETK